MQVGTSSVSHRHIPHLFRYCNQLFLLTVRGVGSVRPFYGPKIYQFYKIVMILTFSNLLESRILLLHKYGLFFFKNEMHIYHLYRVLASLSHAKLLKSSQF